MTDNDHRSDRGGGLDAALRSAVTAVRCAGLGSAPPARRLAVLADTAREAGSADLDALAGAQDALDQLYALLDQAAHHAPGGPADVLAAAADAVEHAWAVRLVGELEAA